MSELPPVLKVPRTDPVYNCHSYLTKVPVGAIEPFLEHFTKPGDTVVDFFAGSGMTGIAALKTGRNAQLSDISALGRHILNGYLTRVGADDLRAAAETACATARKGIKDFYTAVRADDDETVEMVRTIWSFSYKCPSCEKPIVYFNSLTDNKTKAPEKCDGCGEKFVRRSWPRGEDVPVAVAVRSAEGRIVEQPVSEHDLKLIEKASKDRRQSKVPSQEISADREMYRRCALGKSGLTDTSAFFSPRNAIALLELWTAINRVEDGSVREKLRFAFTAILGRASRRYQWGPKRPLNAQNQTYYIAPVYYEWNIFELFMRKVNAAIRSDGVVFESSLFNDNDAEVRYELASADTLFHLRDASVDYVFTDPPFGSNIFYSDMNLFHEAWLRTITDRSCEAVIETAKKKREASTERYENLLTGAFAEAYRILKPGGHMSVVFGNSNGAVWALVQRALRKAGFDRAPVHVTILDKGQRSVKGLASGSESVATVDLVLTVEKPVRAQGRKRGTASATLERAVAAELLAEAILSLDQEKARNPSYVYAALLRVAIKKHLSVEKLHLSDVLVALRKAGYTVDTKTGLLARPATTTRVKPALESQPSM